MKLYSRSAARQSVIDTVAFRAISQLATIISYVVMVRAMTMEDFGVFNLLYAFIPVFSTVASLGLEQTLRRFQPEYLRVHNYAAAAWLLRFVASARFGTNVLLMSLVLLAWNYVAPTFKLASFRAEFALFCLLMLVHFQARILQLSLASHMMHRYSVGSMAILSVCKLIAYGLLAWFGAMTLVNAIVADIVAYGVSFLFTQVASRKEAASTRPRELYHPPPEERKRLFRYGMYNNFNDAGTLFLTSKTDNFFIAAFIDPISVATYAFYTRINEMVGQLLPVRLFENVVQPLFFSISPDEAQRRIPQYFSFLLNLNLVLQWPILAFCVSYHTEIVKIVFGGKYIEYSWLLPVVAAFATLNVISTPVTLVAQYNEKVRIILLSKVFAIYNVIAMVVLLPVAGLYGAAFASGSAQAIKNAFIWWHVRHLAVWINARAALWSGILLWSGAVGACYAEKAMFPLPPLVDLFLGMGICAAVTWLYLRSPALSASDRTILASTLREKEAGILRRLGILQ